jgi:hypothetical protein
VGLDAFHPAGQFSPREQHDPIAFQAFQTDICTQAHYFPVITPTGMWFAQGYNVFHLNFGEHTEIIPYVIAAAA